MFSAAQLPEIDDDRKGKVNPLNANFEKKEFQELWSRINRKAIYAVDFETNELIEKCIKTLDKELKVTPLQYTVIAGEQKDEATYDAVKKGDAFVVKESATDHLTSSAGSAVKYDLIGKLAEDDAAHAADHRDHPAGHQRRRLRPIQERTPRISS